MAKEIIKAVGNSHQKINLTSLGSRVRVKKKELPINEVNFKMENEAGFRMRILDHALDSAYSIYNLGMAEEKLKAKWRGRFIWFFGGLLLITVVCALVLLILDSVGRITVSTTLAVGIFASIIAEIFAILTFMVKYINNTQYLEYFSTISNELLNYLVKDKASGEHLGRDPALEKETT